MALDGPYTGLSWVFGLVLVETEAETWVRCRPRTVHTGPKVTGTEKIQRKQNLGGRGGPQNISLPSPAPRGPSLPVDLGRGLGFMCFCVSQGMLNPAWLSLFTHGLPAVLLNSRCQEWFSPFPVAAKRQEAQRRLRSQALNDPKSPPPPPTHPRAVGDGKIFPWPSECFPHRGALPARGVEVGRRAGLGILASEWQESVCTLWDPGFRISSSDSASDWQRSGLPFARASTLGWALPGLGVREAWCSALTLGPAPNKLQGIQVALAPFQRLA